MSDDSATDQAAGGQAPIAVPLTVNAQYVKDLSFENPHAPRSLLPGAKPPEVGVTVDVRAQPLGDNVFEVALTVRAEANRDGQTAFLAELTYAGVFTLGDVPQDIIRPVLLIEGPRLLFPFARAILSDAVRDGGFPPLLINPIDFADLYRRRMAEAGQDDDAPPTRQ